MACLDYGEEMHWSRIIGNIIGYKMGFYAGWGLHHGQDFPSA
jgi:hypothetical protein